MKKSTKHASSSHLVLILPPRWPLYVPDGIACSKWAEASGFMCAGCAHVRPRGSLSICFFLTGKQMSVKVLLYLHAFQQIFFNTLGNNISNTHS